MSENTREVIGICPECKKDIIEGQKGFGCSGYTEGCKFTIWKTDKFLERFSSMVDGNKVPVVIDKDRAKIILETGKFLVKNLISKKETTYDANFIFAKNDNGYYGYTMEFPDRTPVIIGSCPDCGSDVAKTQRGYSCTGYTAGCKFVIWNLDRYKKEMTPEMATEFLKERRLFVEGLYSEKKSNYFNTNLVLIKEDDKWKTNFEF